MTKIRLGYVPIDKETGRVWRSNDRTAQVYKTKKAAIQGTEFIRAYFNPKIEYAPVYVDTELEIIFNNED